MRATLVAEGTRAVDMRPWVASQREAGEAYRTAVAADPELEALIDEFERRVQEPPARDADEDLEELSQRVALATIDGTLAELDRDAREAWDQAHAWLYAGDLDATSMARAVLSRMDDFLADERIEQQLEAQVERERWAAQKERDDLERQADAQFAATQEDLEGWRRDRAAAEDRQRAVVADRHVQRELGSWRKWLGDGEYERVVAEIRSARRA
jgi:hypothetical protein